MSPGSPHLARLTWPAVAEQARGWLLAVPLGSTEQHGPHLPLSTDTAIAEALAHRLADRRPDVVIAPSIPYGSSGEHAAFGGTLSIGAPALRAVLIEVVRSADAFAGVVIVNAHGGNAGPLTEAVTTLTAEGRRVLAWSPRRSVMDAVAAPVDDHAGRTETSMVLALDPDAVLSDRAVPGCTTPLADLVGTLVDHGVGAVSANGVLGDPRGASAGEGDTLLEALAADLISAVSQW